MTNYNHSLLELDGYGECQGASARKLWREYDASTRKSLGCGKKSTKILTKQG